MSRRRMFDLLELRTRLTTHALRNSGPGSLPPPIPPLAPWKNIRAFLSKEPVQESAAVAADDVIPAEASGLGASHT